MGMGNAPPICEDAAARTGSSRRGDTQLAPVWDWGHTELSFHPEPRRIPASDLR